MKILVIGGMHGNEPLGLELVNMFKRERIKNIDSLYANEQAIKKNVRFVNQDLNRSFPGNNESDIYEQKRAFELLKICQKYDLVFDFHNTHCPNNNCTFVGSSAKDLLYDVSGVLGLNRIIVADYECINKYASNCISVEISLSSKKRDTNIWLKQIKKLSTMIYLPKQTNIQKYRFVYRMTLEDQKKFQLQNHNLKAFKALSKELADKMNVESPAFPIFVQDAYTPYNFGGLLNILKKNI